MADRAEPIEGGRLAFLSARVTREYREWVASLARDTGRSVSQVIGAGLIAEAARVGFDRPAPPR